jgi:hypothetical protein
MAKHRILRCHPLRHEDPLIPLIPRHHCFLYGQMQRPQGVGYRAQDALNDELDAAVLTLVKISSVHRARLTRQSLVILTVRVLMGAAQVYTTERLQLRRCSDTGAR